MKNLTVKDIIKCTKGKLIKGDENFICKNYSNDTRAIKKDDVYIALKGENYNGNTFWRDALDKGAKVAIIEDIDFSTDNISKYEDKIIIKVENTLNALQQIAKYKRTLYNIPVIAITGSVGKTSTKDIVASVVSQKYKTLKTEGNNNNHIGLPFTILKLQDHEALVIEMGMNHFGEISLLTDIAKPTLSIITNIGTSHIGLLGSRENILKAKLEILEGMANPQIIINNDNDLLHKWYESNKENYLIYTYGIENSSNINANCIGLEENKSTFIAQDEKSNINITVPIGGKHFIYNALCATMVGKVIGLEEEQIKRGIENVKITKKRMDIIKLKNSAEIINDAYNASYESMKAALEYLKNTKAKRKIAVLGDMFELGEFGKELHQKVGVEVAKNKIDILICCGENSKYIVETAKQNGMKEDNIFYYENKTKIINKLKEILTAEDIALVKASNGMKFSEIIENLE